MFLTPLAMVLPANAAAESSEAQGDLRTIPVWLTLQRCRGLGWLHAGQGGCLGVAGPGGNAAVFSRVTLVPANRTSSQDAAGGTIVTNNGEATNYADLCHAPSGRPPAASGDPALRILDEVSPVEVEAPTDETEEDGYGDSGSLYAALISPSMPTRVEGAQANSVQGDFVVMHHVRDEQPRDEDDLEELHLCFGELLWHSEPPRLFACRSMWTAPQHMRLTKVAEHQQQPEVAAAAPAAATESKFVLVLSDVEEDPAYGKTGVPSFPGISVAALRSLRNTLGDRESVRRIASDTLSLSLHSLRQAPESLSCLASSTADVIHKAAVGWAAAGAAAARAAAAAGEKLQQYWHGSRGEKDSRSSDGTESGKGGNT